MDIISHGLWGGAVLGRKSKKKFAQAFVISMLPDLLSLGVFWVSVFLGFSDFPAWNGRHLDYRALPTYVHVLYSFTHSLLFFAILFFAVWDWRKKPFMPLLAWGVHILIDIPSHSFIAFPTPFLWPLSDYKYDGVSWVDARMLVPNVLFLCVAYLGYFYYQKIKEKNQEEEWWETEQ